MVGGREGIKPVMELQRPCPAILLCLPLNEKGRTLPWRSHPAQQGVSRELWGHRRGSTNSATSFPCLETLNSSFCPQVKASAWFIMACEVPWDARDWDSHKPGLEAPAPGLYPFATDHHRRGKVSRESPGI